MSQLAYFYIYQGENVSPDITHRGEPRVGMTFTYKGIHLTVTSLQHNTTENKVNIILDKV